ncbi:MAG: aminomethyl-transferring glycine dehydrogenase subunit GcvPA [Verrucomicrobiae bacterium]|nr:aminomethyl-transferring glycine dehydrogenase subunit GcvPA [Verrucomicrobiae bacterium]
MDFVPNSEAEFAAMLQASGVSSFDDLVSCIPAKLKEFRSRLPAPLTEMELVMEMEKLAASNRTSRQVLSFLGAGIYDHFIPPAVDALASRGEFVTAYTPYQAEASQGTLTAIYEYQSYLCAITGMEVSNASLYDGASAVAEAGFLSLQANSNRPRIVHAASLHPEYLATLQTYLAGQKAEFVSAPLKDGVLDLDALAGLVNPRTCALIVQSPNFHGCLEPMAQAADIAHRHGAFFVACVNPISLGLIRPPGEYNADFAVGEGQPLGCPMSFGGPGFGFLTSTKKLVHKISGRIVGQTVDENNQRSFCLTLQAREQHIRREKATSNICSNQALMALRACIHLALLGKRGFQQVAQLNHQRAHAAAAAICGLRGFSLAFKQPFFNEFTIRCPVPSADLLARLEKENLIPGLAVADPNAKSSNLLLVCVTETKTSDDIQRLVKALAAFSTP